MYSQGLKKQAQVRRTTDVKEDLWFKTDFLLHVSLDSFGYVCIKIDIWIVV